MDKYFLKEKCPQCSHNLKIGYKYCPNCGILVSNDGPRVKRTSFLGKKDLTREDIPLAKPLLNVYDSLSKSINASDKILNADIYPLIVKIGEEVELLKFNKEIILEDGSILANDYKGYYFKGNPNSNSFVNKKLIDPNKKYYLLNNDLIEVNALSLVYTILDQEDVKWCKTKLGEDFTLDVDFIEYQNGRLYIKPSSNGLYLNNKKIYDEILFNNKDFVLNDSRMFILKDNNLFYQDKLEDYQKKSKAIFAVNICKDDFLDVDIREKVVMTENGPKTLLKDIKFKAQPGELILVLGSSGAGKSTLFKEFLNENNANSSISIGNIDFARNFNLVKRMVSTVPQFDLSRDNDTVFMTLKNSGQLKLPRDFTKDENLLDDYVLEILKMMNLDRIKDSLVRDLSGGERKRLSIASEYISSPVVFLLDEPDSGLDGYNARSIMANLRTIADNDKIIMLISHSPDRVIELFDKILVLGKSQSENCGKLAFYGSPKDAMEFFATKNIETIVDRLLEDTDYYIDKFRRGGESELPI
ncbi:ATP-binding cassette domain-containing protein [Anaerococcus sp. NML200537]|uniref:ATP-binding cassette domain-containing protein n=1 Tax=Anaerococcus sp. NML200537 TaxID=2954485 RepID=UPI002237A008|nr:ATP-binding cassette domain-containing protein [Anaerococcus sp. NML200537]MCW6702287.1 ATP-binding cassette domain-containing protein [Anaerococcus sp. NML200537]